MEIATIGSKIVETWDMSSNGITKQSAPIPLSFSESWGVCCFLQEAWTTALSTLHEKLAKCQRGPLEQSFSTILVTDCRTTC